MKKKIEGGPGRGGGQGRCERRIEVFVKMKENSEGGGGQGGCEHEDLNYCDSAKQLGGGKRTLSLLQNMSEKIKIFKRKLLKKSYRFFFNFHLIIYSLYPTS